MRVCLRACLLSDNLVACVHLSCRNPDSEQLPPYREQDPSCCPSVTRSPLPIPDPWQPHAVLRFSSFIANMLYERSHMACELWGRLTSQHNSLKIHSNCYVYQQFIPFYCRVIIWRVSTRVCLTVHLLKDIFVAFSLGLLQMSLLWTLASRFDVNIK